MNQQWAQWNKELQMQLKKEETFDRGIDTLLTLRQSLMAELLRMKAELRADAFCARPFPQAKGYHCKTIAYSIWHIFRIEDIVAHDLIAGDGEVFWQYQHRLAAPIITTGNELEGQALVDFSRALDIETLYDYAQAVKESTDGLLKTLTFRDMNRKFDESDQRRLEQLQVVTDDESGNWLIEFWCGKNVRGLLQMPFSRHWIMHIEACIRMENKIRKGVQA